MKLLIGAVIFFLSVALSPATDLEEVANLPNQQVTGVTVSKNGRIFVNFPDWSDDHTISVAELINRQPKAFPNEQWNKLGPPATHFVCVQSVVVDTSDALWVLDPAAPKMQDPVPGGSKLIKIDLKTNQVVQTIPFSEEIAPKKSYLNDVHIDTNTATAYITDSGKGAIVVVDLKTSKARRLLDGHPSTQGEPGFKLVVEGRELIDQQKKSPPQINSDGIALDLNNDDLYYHALTGHTLYRIKGQYLRDPSLSRGDLESRVEKVAQTPAPDRMIEAPDDSIYLTDIEDSAIARWNPATRKVSQVIQDRRLSWPDTLSWGPEGALYVTCSQIQNSPRFNSGASSRTEPYRLFKVIGVR